MSRRKKLIVCSLAVALSGAIFAVYDIFTQGKTHLAPSQAGSNSPLTAAAVRLEKTLPPAQISTLISAAKMQGEAAEQFYSTPPASLSGVAGPARLRTDAKGNLLVEKRVQRLFEFWLTTTGEEPLEDIVARIKHDLASHLDSLALSQAIDLLEAYLQYRNHIGVIKNNYAELQDVRANNLDMMRELKLAVRESRSKFLPQEAIDSFFLGEDEYDDYMFERVQILADDSLSATDKRSQLELLDMSSPSHLVRARAQALQISEVRSAVEEMRNSGLGSDHIYRYREQEYGAQVAQRLNSLDSRRQLWQSRLVDYRSELQSLDLGAQYPPAEREQLIEAVRAQHFGPQEALRVRALDSMQHDSAADE